MRINEADIIAFARSLEGTTIYTRARRKPFKALVSGGRISYQLADSPESTPRPEGGSALAKTLDKYNETGSLTTTDYQIFSVNASYTLTLIDMFVRQHGTKR